MPTNYANEWYQAYAAGLMTHQQYADEHTRTGGTFPNPPGISEEDLGGLPAYFRSLGLARQPTFGPGGARLARQFAPAREAFLGATAARGGALPAAGTFPEAGFTDFLTSLGGPSTANIGRVSSTAFNDLLRALGARGTTPLTAGQEQYGLPETQEEFGGGASLARQAAAGRMGGLAAQYLVPTETDLYRRFLQRNPVAQVEQWLPWLQTYLGLNR